MRPSALFGIVLSLILCLLGAGCGGGNKSALTEETSKLGAELLSKKNMLRGMPEGELKKQTEEEVKKLQEKVDALTGDEKKKFDAEFKTQLENAGKAIEIPDKPKT